MYEVFFGLRSRPFSPLPRVDNYIPLAPIREPLESLKRCINQEQGIGVLTASQGAGKSLICRLLHHHFREVRRTVLLTTARFPTRRALLQAILFEMKHPYVGLSEQEARLRIFDLLQASPAPLHSMLLIVDEAHLLSPRGLEELRILTDYELAGTPCVSLILSGQLELEELLTEPALNAFNQRVGCHACIEPLTFEESNQYIRERLRFAGNDGLTILTPEAIQLICSASEGNPRRLNQLCDHSLLLAFAEEQRPVDVSTVRNALLDLRELPLHWNAPLDLSGLSHRNPLEEFAESYKADRASLDEEPLAECDTDIDVEDGSALDVCPDSRESSAESSVYEVGGHVKESPFDQLFQVTNFVVPGGSRGADENLMSSNIPVSSMSDASAAFETTPPEIEMPPAPQIEPVTNETLPGSGFEFGSELLWGETPLSPSNSATPVSRTEFEELVVDDAYALIDQQLESTRAGKPFSRTAPLWHAAALNPATASLDSPSPTPPSVEIDADIDDTLFDDSLAHEVIEVPFATSTPETEVPSPILLESQLLNFINEVSLDVQSFRAEVEAARSESLTTNAAFPDHDLAHHAQHHSLRQTLNWHFDVVEPEAEADDHESTTPETEQQVRSIIQEAAPLEQPPAATSHPAVTREAEAGEDRRYSLLFTRLQRQRRRVETVINRERRTGS